MSTHHPHHLESRCGSVEASRGTDLPLSAWNLRDLRISRPRDTKFPPISLQNGFVECLKQQCPSIEGCYALLEPGDNECCYRCTGKYLRAYASPLIQLIILIVLIGPRELAAERTGERWKKMGGVCRRTVRRKGENSRNARSAEHCSRGTKALLFADTVINPKELERHSFPRPSLFTTRSWQMLARGPRYRFLLIMLMVT